MTVSSNLSTFTLAKTSHHQADIAERADRILNGSAVSMTEHSTTEARKIRPIAIGEAWLRAAERAYMRQGGEDWGSFLMLFQFGVKVPGGINEHRGGGATATQPGVCHALN